MTESHSSSQVSILLNSTNMNAIQSATNYPEIHLNQIIKDQSTIFVLYICFYAQYSTYQKKTPYNMDSLIYC